MLRKLLDKTILALRRRIPMSDVLNRLLRMSQSADFQSRRNFTLNPILKLVAVFSMPCFAMVYLMKDREGFAIAFFVCGLLPAILAGYSYIYLLHKHPEFIDTEEYRIQREALQIIAQKGEPIPGSALEAIANPKHHPIGGERE